MIIKEMFQAEDVYEYAAYCGFRDAAHGKPPTSSYWTQMGVGSELEDIYYIAYLSEIQQGIYFRTSEHSCVATVLDWNDLTGYGYVKVDNDAHNFTEHFSYMEMNQDIEVANGQSVLVKFTYEDKGVVIHSVTV